MKDKKVMLTNSPAECAGLCAGLLLSLILIVIAAACADYGAFYCSVLVQAINTLVMYTGVTPSSHKGLPFGISIVLRGCCVFAIALSVAFFAVSTSEPQAGTIGIAINDWLSTFEKGGVLTSAVLAVPFLECLFEGAVYLGHSIIKNGQY